MKKPPEYYLLLVLFKSEKQEQLKKKGFRSNKENKYRINEKSTYRNTIRG